VGEMVTTGMAGFVSTFHTTLDRTEKQHGNQHKNKAKKRDGMK
jgi:hypothetical protein